MSNETKEYSIGGQPIYRHERKKDFEIPDSSDSSIEQIVAYFEKHLGTTATVFHEIISDLVHIDVHVIEPNEERDYYTLFTTGMSDKPMHVPNGLDELKYAEIYTCLPKEWLLTQESFKDETNYWPVRVLKTLARLPHEYDTWLGLGHTVPNGDPTVPYAQDTKLCCAMVTYPMMVEDTEDFMQLKIRDDKVINFYYIFPLYEEEMNYKLHYGADKLIDRFEKNDIDIVIDPNRKNVC